MSEHRIGDRLSFNGDLSTVRYVGQVDGTKGEWLGVEWDDPTRGKHGGAHDGRSYFQCIIDGAGSFIRPNKKADSERTFVDALLERYAPLNDPSSNDNDVEEIRASWISGKPIVTVGFAKMSQRFAQLDKLRVITLTHSQISTTGPLERLAEVCPGGFAVEELDLSWNVLSDLCEVGRICAAFPGLKTLRLNSNRFHITGEVKVPQGAFLKLELLTLNVTYLTWDEVVRITMHFPALRELQLGYNAIQTITATGDKLPEQHGLQSLQVLNLEGNGVERIEDIAWLSTLPNLHSLILSRNKLTTLTNSTTKNILPTFKHLTALDLSRNQISSWSDIDALNALPTLSSLRVAHNPLYTPTRDREDVGRMELIARLPNVWEVNGTDVKGQERVQAELWYLARAGREGGEWTRLGELRAKYGASVPDSNATVKNTGRKVGSASGALASRVPNTKLVFYPSPPPFNSSPTRTLEKRLVPGTTVGAFRSLCGKLFRIPPTKAAVGWRNCSTEEEGEAEVEVMDDDLRRVEYYSDVSIEGEVVVWARN
ncbi:RNI-like protein [Saitoella complicata NRRL Y-17804]|uniref:CAP-Gly domain-containing protein n=1 Tax=Saitoella complicata (strain BCRC 22490 / CBS 7301 / JCM 7358 / NBRC 10748 / NRRL Y-17804) TaxID=698492 RepID=A0A0E9NHW2_SAICN|nr:RNI-like protein [Saitoella complicata NRRL Y-17804]ODQ53040.1 RNI-like protein [Saitoella complicata NRRL Y-17804]GAO48995.1 hypothetical protein G7K_3156-t1 [Saitoella complicata NRRL Y-17804]